MKQRMIMALTALFTVMGSTFLPRLEAAALTTEQRYHQSRIVMMTTQDNVIRFDGAVGWLVSDTVVLGKR